MERATEFLGSVIVVLVLIYVAGCMIEQFFGIQNGPAVLFGATGGVLTLAALIKGLEEIHVNYECGGIYEMVHHEDVLILLKAAKGDVACDCTCVGEEHCSCPCHNPEEE